jgi:hypothetical protein
MNIEHQNDRRKGLPAFEVLIWSGMPRSPRDLTGLRFGKLLVRKLSSKTNGYYKWICVCDCGKYAIPATSDLTSGHTTSCGCAHIEASKTHGKRYTRAYVAFKNMMKRCYDHNDTRSTTYKERSIQVCDRWRDNFENFFSDMGECPRGLTLERRDNTKGYSPENCYWATHKEQQRNMRSNVFVTYNGETKCVAEWAELLGVPHYKIYQPLMAGKPLNQIFARLGALSENKLMPQPKE